MRRLRLPTVRFTRSALTGQIRAARIPAIDLPPRMPAGSAAAPEPKPRGWLRDLLDWRHP